MESYKRIETDIFQDRLLHSDMQKGTAYEESGFCAKHTEDA